MSLINQWTYLGDGVYFMFDGSGIWLHANSHDHPTDKIYLEPEVIHALLMIIKRITDEGQKESSANG